MAKKKKEKKPTLPFEAVFAAEYYHRIQFEHICRWCVENGKEAWLDETLEKTAVYPIYPTKTYTGKDGELHTVYDKRKKPIGEEVKPLSYVDVRKAFCEAFMPHLLPKAAEEKKTISMKDKWAAAKAKYSK